MPLTDAKLRTLKSKSTAFKVSDAEGLYLLVAPSGSKLWRLADVLPTIALWVERFGYA